MEFPKTDAELIAELYGTIILLSNALMVAGEDETGVEAILRLAVKNQGRGKAAIADQHVDAIILRCLDYANAAPEEAVKWWSKSDPVTADGGLN